MTLGVKTNPKDPDLNHQWYIKNYEQQEYVYNFFYEYSD